MRACSLSMPRCCSASHAETHRAPHLLKKNSIGAFLQELLTPHALGELKGTSVGVYIGCMWASDFVSILPMLARP